MIKKFFYRYPSSPCLSFCCLFEFHKFIVNLIFTHMEFWVYVTGIPVLWSEYFLTFFCTQTPFRRVTRIHLYFNRSDFLNLVFFRQGGIIYTSLCAVFLNLVLFWRQIHFLSWRGKLPVREFFLMFARFK